MEYRENRKKGRASFNEKNKDRAPLQKETRELDENIIFGRNSVKELLTSGRDIEKIYVTRGEREGSINLLIALAKERKIVINETDRQRLDALSCGGKHQGIVAVATERDYSSIDEIIDYARERGEAPLLIVCDGVEDPHNLGAIIRSADCLGAHGIIIPKRRAAGLTATVSKASAGALEYMKVARVTNLPSAIEELKEKGLWIYAADMGDEPYYDTDLRGPMAIVLGSEGFGISRLVREKCDFTLSIPLLGGVNSMNVSCAAAVLLAECAKQRRKGDTDSGK